MLSKAHVRPEQQHILYDIAKLLIEAGANINVKHNIGLSALDFAKRLESETLFELFEEALHKEQQQYVEEDVQTDL